jgi:ATP-dependent helicase/nuclease subunit A
MTIHGAKGLQAPVVILPDTIRKPEVKDKLLWNPDDLLPIWTGSVLAANAYCRRVREDEKIALHAEYRRQLYVAMTRAEDMLFIYGSTEHKAVPEESWYDLIAQGLRKSATITESAQGQGMYLGRMPASRPLAEVALQPVKTEDKTFEYLHVKLEAEPEPSKPISPSKLPDDAPAGASPLQAKKTYSRGLCIHMLLQHLPAFEANERAAVAQHIASRHASSLTGDEIQGCIAEASQVLADPAYGFIFAPESLAEVPVTGIVSIKGKAYTVSGQIDRLCIGSDIWIVDFKSGGIPPASTADISRHYLRQMTLYKLLLSQIYPNKRIRCALLWTATAKMTEIPDAMLDEQVFSSYI